LYYWLNLWGFLSNFFKTAFLDEHCFGARPENQKIALDKKVPAGYFPFRYQAVTNSLHALF
jgi:hypothetical protein